MLFRKMRFVMLSIILSGSTSLTAQDFELGDGDRVVFLGSEFVEQAIKHNYLEAELTQRWSDRDIQFRNLGWSGDSPDAIARGYFGGQQEGWRRLGDELKRVNPTVVFLAYTVNGKSEEFQTQFERLFRIVASLADRIVIVTSPPAIGLNGFEETSAQLNRERQKSADWLRDFAASQGKGVYFVDLFADMNRQLETSDLRTISQDSIRYTAEGYRAAAKIVMQSLQSHVHDHQGKQQREFDRLRELIGEKNLLYFHRYRPQNETYLRGFRKHEQGQNAKEIAAFDPLIERCEERIRALVRGLPLPAAIAHPDPVTLSFEAMPPEAERAEFTLADGLEVNLFASEPMVANPIHMNFDHRGRLWVATSPIYPQIMPGARASDEIIILEDTDQDGRADKKTVFADDLLIPTAVLPDGQGGAYVANSTEILHLTDSDGDGKADSRRVLLAGFGTEDTHHIIHTFRWGHDAAFYFNQSIYIHTHIETPFGVRRLMGSGIWRYVPESGHAEVQMRGLVNPWGHVFDRFGQSFATDGAGGDGINYVFPGAAYPSAVGYRKVLRGMNPGQPKHCGLEMVHSRHFPQEWQGTLVTNDFRGNRINRFQLSEQGSGYLSRQLPDLLTSKHGAFRPVDLKLGPDGSLFIADWYNPIINHGEVDFRDSRRDYKHGRIWRITASGRPLNQLPDFESASNTQLLEMLKLPEQWNREQARLQLKFRPADSVLGDLNRWTQNLDPSAAGDHLRLQALWTYQAIRRESPTLLDQLLESPDHHIRAAAVRVIGHQRPGGTERNLAKLVEDEHPQVRLEAVNALRKCGSATAAESAMNALDQPVDQYISFSLDQTIRELEPAWFPKLESGEVDFGGDLNKQLYALRLVGSEKSVDPLLKHLTSKSLSAEIITGITNHVAEFGNAQQLGRLLGLALENGPYLNPTLESLNNTAERRKLRPAGLDLNQLRSILDDPRAVRLAGIWKVEALQPDLIELVTQDSKARPALKVAAINGIAGFGNSGILHQVASQARDETVQLAAIAELVRLAPKTAAGIAAAKLSRIKSAEQGKFAEQLVNPFLQRRQTPGILAAAVEAVQLDSRIAEIGMRRATSIGDRGKPLVAAFEKAGAVSKMKRRFSAEDIQAIIADIANNGDAGRGELVYRRQQLSCIKCHAIGGAGGIVGPDLVSLGSSSPVDYILESLLDPDAKIKEGYHTTNILTVDGRQVAGKLVSESENRLTLRDAENRELVFEIDEIDERKIGSTSLMPVDLLKDLRRDELIDLVAFLSALGKEGKFKVTRDRFVRRWLKSDGDEITTRVDGSLPVSELTDNRASFEIEVVEAGPIGLQIENPRGLRITRDDAKDNLRAEKIVLDLPLGRHKFNFQITNPRSRESLRVSLFDVPGSSGRAVPRNQ